LSIKRLLSIIGVLSLICIALLFSGCCCFTGSQVYSPTPYPTTYPTTQAIYSTPEPTYSLPPASSGNSNAILDETKDVPKGYYQYYSVVLSAYKTVNVDISTDGAGITFLVMDSNNFDKYNSGMLKGDQAIWNNYISENSVVQKSFEFTAPATDRYYFVIDNTGRVQGAPPAKRDINVHVTIT
jgi:hypothetical protein